MNRKTFSKRAFFSAFLIPVFACVSFLFPTISFAASHLVIYPYTISSGNPDASSAMITWQTNLAGTSSISYGPTTAYGTGAFSVISSTTYSLPLTGLSANTIYHYEIFSYDANGDIATSSDQTFTTVYSCTYYVDSVNGNDANNGTDANTPFQHLAAVPVVSNGATICLRRGSTFHDSLYVGIPGSMVNNVTVRDYGPTSLPIPMVDNSDVIASSSWTAVGGGYSNLYQATVPSPITATSTPYGNMSESSFMINVFECKTAPCTPLSKGGNDLFLDNSQTTESGANSEAGSFYIPGQSESANPTETNGTVTIYLHTSDGSSPITNGYAYSYSHRLQGIEVAGTNDSVINIASKKGAANDGSIAQYNNTGGATLFSGIESDQGGKHNAICGGGCTIANSSFYDENYPFGDMVVFFENTGQGLGVTVASSTFVNYSNGSDSFGYSHTASGDIGPLAYNNDVGIGLNGSGAFDGGTSQLILNNDIASTTSWLTNPGVSTTTITNSQYFGSAAVTDNSAVLVAGITGVNSVSINNLKACAYQLQNGLIQVNPGASNLKLSIASSTFWFTSTNNLYGVYLPAGTSLTMNDTTMDSNHYPEAWVSMAGANYVGDYNTFVSPYMVYGGWNGGYIGSFAIWQATTSQDVHSTTTSPTPTVQTQACTPQRAFVYSFTGPSSGNVNSPSSNFTVTPNGVYTGTITLTPGGTGSTGLSPVTLSWNNSSSSQTFVITPTAAGAITLMPSNAGTSGVLVNAGAVSYTANIVAPSAPYGTPVAVAGNTAASVSWSAPVSIGGSAVTGYTVTSSPGNISTSTSATSNSATLTGLTNGVAYTFTVTATNIAGTSASSTASNQVTPSTMPSVTTGAASGITTTSVTLNGAITAIGGSNPTQSGFIYSTDPSFMTGIATSTLGAQTGTTTLSQIISSLTCNTAYYFQTYATNVSGTGYGTTQTFTTSVCPSNPAPTVTYASGGGGGTASAAELASILAPGPATTAYLNSLKGLSAGQQAVTATTDLSAFTKYLEIGTVGSEVKTLQQYLNDNGYSVAKSGPGSPGNETDTFGSLTKAALEKFQKAHGLPDTGYFGPMTIKLVNSL